MDLGHKGKTVIISGGSKGIGAGSVKCLHRKAPTLSSITTVIKNPAWNLPATCQNAMESEQQLFRVMWERKKM